MARDGSTRASKAGIYALRRPEALRACGYRRVDVLLGDEPRSMSC